MMIQRIEGRAVDNGEDVVSSYAVMSMVHAPEDSESLG